MNNQNIHITLLGKEILALYYPIKQFLPDAIYIIGTSETKDLASRLRLLLTQKQEGKLAEEMPTIPSVNFVEVDAFGLKSVVDACKAIHETHPEVTQENFMYHITGGTKIMTLGAFLVAREKNAQIIYTESNNIKYLHRETDNEEPLQCKLSLAEIIAMQGQIIKNGVPFNFQESLQDIDAARKVCKFIQNRRYIYAPLFNKLRQKPKDKEITTTIPNEIQFKIKGQRYTCRCEQLADSELKNLTITNDKGRKWLDITCKEPKKMLLKGVWWETLVAEAISHIFPECEIWTNVEFRPVDNPETEGVKNEIDVLVNLGKKLLFIECKSGMFDSNNIHKIRTVRSTFGGEKSKGVIISASVPTSTDHKKLLEENAKDSNIPILSPKESEGYASFDFLYNDLPILLQQIVSYKTI